MSFFVLRQSSGRLSPEILLAMFGDEIYQHSLDTPEQKVDLVNAGPNGESIRLQMVSEILLCPPAGNESIHVQLLSLCFILKQSHKYPSSNSQKNSAAAPRSLLLEDFFTTAAIHNGRQKGTEARRTHPRKVSAPFAEMGHTCSIQFAFKRIVDRCAGAVKPSL